MSTFQLSIEEIERQRAAFLAYNEARLRQAADLFTAVQRDLFSVLPLLLHGEWQGDGLPAVPGAPYGIRDYTPRRDELEAAARLLPGLKLTFPQGNGVFSSLTVMGSIGTIAQTSGSDLDYGLFFSDRDLDSGERKLLQQKLRAIEEWMTAGGIETHIFPTSIEDFQNNRFGSADQENVGSSQARLFKDEFFRTAVVIAGLPLLWWLIPPGLSESDLPAWRTELAALLPDGLAGYLDLGQVYEISSGEFFGAALWQINKAFYFPFKSLLKMGLLEAYLIGDAEPLCDGFKRRVIEEGPGGNHCRCDPYRLMVERVVSFSQKQRMQSDAKLLRAAFMLKAGVESRTVDRILASPPRHFKDRCLEFLIRHWDIAPSDLAPVEKMIDNTLSARASGQGDISTYFLKVYGRLSRHLQRSGDVRMIDPEDMTLLGRKLFTYYRDSPTKVPLLPPSLRQQAAPQEITLRIDRARHLPEPTFELYDFHFGSAAEATIFTHISPPFQRMGDRLRLLVWMVINRFWSPNTRLDFKGDVTDGEPEQVNGLLTTLYRFFVAEEHQPGEVDYLHSRRVLRAFVIPHRQDQGGKGRIAKVETVTVDSWGEYHIQQQSPATALKETALMLGGAEEEGEPLRLEVHPLPDDRDHTMVQGFFKAVERFRNE